MDESIPRPVREAGGMLLETLLAVAGEREDVRRALTTVNAWLARELSRRAEIARADGSRSRAPRGAEHDGERVHERHAARSENGLAHSDVLTPRGPGASYDESRPIELPRIHARAAWKAEALALALDKRAAGPAHGADLRAREADLRARQSAAGAPWAWMLDAPPARVADGPLQALAECYQTIARIAAGIGALESDGAFDPAPPVELLRVVAEGQSCLLAALGAVGLRQDEDQRDLFQWLRDRTTRHRIYVDRHMRLEDPADPNDAPELRRRFERLLERATQQSAGRRQRGPLLNKVRFHVSKLLNGSTAPEGDWESLNAALERWRELELPADDRGLLEIVSPLTPERVAGREVGAALASALEASQRLAGGARLAPQGSTVEAAELLRGRRAMMIAERADEGSRLELLSTLGLSDLGWHAMDGAPEGPERVERIVERLRREPIDVVFMGLKLPQDEYQVFKEHCVELQVPFVRLPGAATAHAVAHQTMRQVGWRLRESKDPVSSTG